MISPAPEPGCLACQEALAHDIADFTAGGLLEDFGETLRSLPGAPHQAPVEELYAWYLAGYHLRGHSDENHDPWEEVFPS